MSADRHAEELAEAIHDEDDAARRGQTRDATRIRREMAETHRIEQAIDALLSGDDDPDTTAG